MEDSHARSRIKRKNNRKILHDFDCVFDNEYCAEACFCEYGDKAEQMIGFTMKNTMTSKSSYRIYQSFNFTYWIR